MEIVISDTMVTHRVRRSRTPEGRSQKIGISAAAVTSLVSSVPANGAGVMPPALSAYFLLIR
jgi:hypothetical protein